MPYGEKVAEGNLEATVEIGNLGFKFEGEEEVYSAPDGGLLASATSSAGNQLVMEDATLLWDIVVKI
jgi:hypothetical protein